MRAKDLVCPRDAGIAARKSRERKGKLRAEQIMSVHKLQHPFMTRMGQFEKDKQTLAVGILESLILVSPPEEMHLLDMGRYVYGSTFAELREARKRYEKHIWVNKDGKRVCIFPVLTVFKAVKEKVPEAVGDKQPTESERLEELMVSFKPEFGNEKHIRALKLIKELNSARSYILEHQEQATEVKKRDKRVKELTKALLPLLK